MSDAALLAVVFGLFSAVGFGLSDFVGAKVSKKFGGTASSILVTVFANVLFALIYLLFFRSHTVWDGLAIAYAAGSGAAFVVANMAFYKALEYGPVNLVSPLGSIYPLVTLLLLVVVWSAHLNFQQVIGIVVVVAGALIASGLLDRRKSKKRLGPGPLLALVAAAFWGIAFGLIAQAISRVGWQWASVVEMIVDAAIFLALIPIFNRREPGLTKKLKDGVTNWWVVIAAVLLQLAYLAVTAGINHSGNLAATVVAVSSCYPVITVFLALRHFKEEAQLVPLIGAFTAVAGIVVLSLG